MSKVLLEDRDVMCIELNQLLVNNVLGQSYISGEVGDL